MMKLQRLDPTRRHVKMLHSDGNMDIQTSLSTFYFVVLLLLLGNSTTDNRMLSGGYKCLRFDRTTFCKALIYQFFAQSSTVKLWL